MRAQLIIEFGRVLSALLVTADGQLVPCSQEIRQVATRHVSTDVLFDPRISEDPDFVWDEALEMLGKATARNLFQRARRIGLRRPWDPQAAADALQLASPIAVLSSPVALADRNAVALPTVAFALLDALLEPVFAFVADRRIAAAAIDPVVVLPAHASRPARLVLEKLFRRRGFRGVTFIRREIAAAMALIDGAPAECVVLDAAEDHLHLHRVAIEAGTDQRRFRTEASTTVRGLGWSHWTAQIAASLQMVASSALERMLLALVTGSPESLESRVTRGALQSVLDEAWVQARADEVREQLRAPLALIGATVEPIVFAGEIFALDAVRKAFGAGAALNGPVLDHRVRAVAQSLLWLRGGESRHLAIARGGTLRLDTGRGGALELLTAAQLPEPGETCHVATELRFAGDSAGTAFLLNLLWGTDSVPQGNATVCALPLELRPDGDGMLRLTLRLRRSPSGRRLSGTIEARLTDGAVAARGQFAEVLEVMR